MITDLTILLSKYSSYFRAVTLTNDYERLLALKYTLVQLGVGRHKLLVYSTKVNGYPVKVMIDSGATADIIDQSCMKRIQLQPTGQNAVTPMSLADNTIVDLRGVCIKTNLRFKNRFKDT